MPPEESERTVAPIPISMFQENAAPHSARPPRAATPHSVTTLKISGKMTGSRWPDLTDDW